MDLPRQSEFVPLPDAERAFVPLPKLLNYLLSDPHSDGESKARYFRRFGFSRDRADELEQALLRGAATGDVVKVESTRYGPKYVVVGMVTTPVGMVIRLTTVWIVEGEDSPPRLVMAYPGW